MKKITQITAITALMLFSFFSCSKPGCTDERSTNYNSEATDDDGTCVFRGDVAFWCLPAVSDSLRIIEGHNTLHFELEGEILDTIGTQYFFAPTGECNAPGVMTIPMEDIPYEFRHYKYRVRGTGLQTIYEGFITLDADECLNIQLQ